MEQKIPISIIIPAYDEETHIGPCLESASWADEMIVVDGGSRDRTREIAARHSARLIQTDNAPAETQRLKGVKQARNDWFFFLDADERVSGTLRLQLEKAVVSPNPPSAFYVLRRNYYYQKSKPMFLHHPDYQLRLFHRREIDSLPGRIHRIPKVRGKTGKLTGELKHFFFTSVQDYLDKLNRYTEIEASYWREEGKIVTGAREFYYFFIRPSARFLQYYILKKGFLDGFFGLFFSLSSAFYDVMVSAKAAQPVSEKNV